MNQTIIRAAEKTDIKALCNLMHALNTQEGYDFRPDEQTILAEWEKFQCFVAVDTTANNTPPNDQSIVGLAYGASLFIPHNAGSWFDIQGIYIKPEARRNGLATRLMRHVITTLNEQGLNAFIIQVRQDNETALPFYKSLGMQEKILDHHRFYLFPDHMDEFLSA